MNNEESKAPFDITQYQKFKRLDKDGEEREYYIIPDDIFDEYLKELPPGTYNKSMTYRAYNGGKLYQIGSDPDRDKEITKAGGEATQATIKQRRTFKEQIDIILAKKDENGHTGLENVTVAMYERAQAGDVKAAQFIRDTAGEKPADTVDLNANVMTEADKTLIEKLKKRTGIEE
jgi:hypothetical protein